MVSSRRYAKLGDAIRRIVCDAREYNAILRALDRYVARAPKVLDPDPLRAAVENLVTVLNVDYGTARLMMLRAIEGDSMEGGPAGKMSSRRYAKPQHQPGTRDENEPYIIGFLVAAGFSVYPLDTPCDLLVGRGRTTHLVEVKTADGRMTDTQVDFVKTWRGCYHLATEPEALIAELRACRAKGRI